MNREQFVLTHQKLLYSIPGMLWLEKNLGPKIFGQTVGIDILPNGLCNLRCPSCPVGNSKLLPTKRMALPMFRKILDKLEREINFRRVWVSSFNEPLLHPECWKFIYELQTRKIKSYISSNLNDIPNLKQVLSAGLTGFRVSVSGFTQKYYGYYHGGDINVVKRNMVYLSRVALDYGTKVMVFYHRYKDNQSEIPMMKSFAEGLGFDFFSTQAVYRPLENMLAYLQGEKLPKKDMELISRLAETPEESFAKLTPNYYCRSHYKQVQIQSDGSMFVCCHAPLKSSLLPGINYLDVPLRDIRKVQRAMPICTVCLKLGGNLFVNNNSVDK
jgi:MoaA/NifB/PqqE/SkfB family radical SAM enzyme